AGRPGDDRVYVVLKHGQIVTIDGADSDTGDGADDNTDDGVVLDISNAVSSELFEEGMLGLAFHPEADVAYVTYVDLDGDLRLVEYDVDPTSGQFGAERPVFTVFHPAEMHYGGALQFGPDGMLYVAVGDGRNRENPHNLANELGKILRIDVRPGGPEPFVVPPDNPFVGVERADGRTWSLGLRNPWRFAIDPTSGDLWVTDVGESRFEEVNRARAAAGPVGGRSVSFGWPSFEGPEPFEPHMPPAINMEPVHYYAHDDGRCAVSGGALYRGAAIPDLSGQFVFGDFCSGEIWMTDGTDEPVAIAQIPAVTSISTGPGGELYATSLDGDVVRFDPAP
ncbi:MAG: PQQ-dependent sugar dehydrogenase, partial [Actinomycetota bacterium]